MPPKAKRSLGNDQKPKTTLIRPDIVQCFRRYEAHGDGEINRETFAVFLRMIDGAISESDAILVLNKFDKGGSGLINYREFLQWLEGDQAAAHAVVPSAKLFCTRRVEFRGEPSLAPGELAIWSSEIRGGMMNGAIPPGSMLVQKVKTANNFFVHLCTGVKREDAIETVPVLAEHAAYFFRHRQHAVAEDPIVEHDKIFAATLLVFKGGFDSKGGLRIPIAEQYTADDRPLNDCCIWTGMPVQTHSTWRSDKGIDWGFDHFGRVVSSDACTNLIVEIPWHMSPASVRWRVLNAIDSLRQQQRELDDLWVLALQRSSFVSVVLDLKHQVEGSLQKRASKLKSFEDELHMHVGRDGCPAELGNVACEIAQQLEGMRGEVAQAYAVAFDSSPSHALLAFKLTENTEQRLQPCSAFKSIKHAWIGDRHCIWGDSRDAVDVTEKVGDRLFQAAYSGGSLRLGAEEMRSLVGPLYNEHGGGGRKRALVIEVSTCEAFLLSDEDVNLVSLRSMVYEDQEVGYNEKKLRKMMLDTWLVLQGYAREVDQLIEVAQEVESSMIVELQVLADELNYKISELGVEKDNHYKMDSLYIHKEDQLFRQDVSKRKAEQNSELRALHEVSRSIASRLKRLQEASAKSDDMLSAISARKMETAKRIYKNGFSLRQLLMLVKEKAEQGQIKNGTTTAEFVYNVVIPETKDRGCCYAQVLPGGPKEPETLMSHWWGNKFLNLVRAICEHASGRADLSLETHKDNDLDKTYWLCIFGVEQHSAMCHKIPVPCTCCRPKSYAGQIDCQMDKFASVMRSIPKHALALDEELTTLARVWVLSELDEAMTGEVKKKTIYCGAAVDRSVCQAPCIPSVLEAQASYPADREMIVGAIEKRDHGVEEFDRNISSTVLPHLAALHVFMAVEDKDLGAVKDEVQKYPVVIHVRRAGGTGRGLNILQLAARLGAIDIVHFLIQQFGVQINQRSGILGWTALHFAAICWDPRHAQNMVRLLLDAHANPELENDFGRTALEEALCATPDSNVAYLLFSVTKKPPGDFYVSRFLEVERGILDLPNICKQPPQGVDFVPHRADSILFNHNKSRLGGFQCGIDLRYAITSSGELHVLSHWNPPFAFPPDLPYPIPCYGHPTLQMLMASTRRLSDYVQYHFPGWTFQTVAINHCGHIYGFDLENNSFTYRLAESEEKFSSEVKFGAQFLYP